MVVLCLWLMVLVIVGGRVVFVVDGGDDYVVFVVHAWWH